MVHLFVWTNQKVAGLVLVNFGLSSRHCLCLLTYDVGIANSIFSSTRVAIAWTGTCQSCHSKKNAQLPESDRFYYIIKLGFVKRGGFNLQRDERVEMSPISSGKKLVI